jgi:hypothetical protein
MIASMLRDAVARDCYRLPHYPGRSKQPATKHAVARGSLLVAGCDAENCCRSIRRAQLITDGHLEASTMEAPSRNGDITTPRARARPAVPITTSKLRRLLRGHCTRSALSAQPLRL